MPSRRSDHVVGVEAQCGPPERRFGEQDVLGSEHSVDLMFMQKSCPAKGAQNLNVEITENLVEPGG